MSICHSRLINVHEGRKKERQSVLNILDTGVMHYGHRLSADLKKCKILSLHSTIRELREAKTCSVVYRLTSLNENVCLWYNKKGDY